MSFSSFVVIKIILSVCVFQSKCICNVHLWQDVGHVLVGSDQAARGVVLKDGTEIHSQVVLSNATAYVTFKHLTPKVTEKCTMTPHTNIAQS